MVVNKVENFTLHRRQLHQAFAYQVAAARLIEISLDIGRRQCNRHSVIIVCYKYWLVTARGNRLIARDSK